MEKQHSSQVVAGSKSFASAILDPHVSLLLSHTEDSEEGVVCKSAGMLKALSQTPSGIWHEKELQGIDDF